MNNNSENNNFIGFIGIGYWGKNIFRNLLSLKVLHTACDSNPLTLSAYKQNYPSVKFTDSYYEILQDKDIKAVIIATPASTHYELSRKAIEHDKDVLVEKPLALNIKDAEELIDLANKKGKILMVGHILLHHPAIAKLKEMINYGEIGKIQYIYSNRLNIGKLRTEENILWSFAPHDISVILWLVGEEPENINAFGGDYLNKGIYDTTITTLEFRNGIKGHIFVSWLHPYKEQKLIVIGTKAMVVFDDISKEKLFLYPHTIQWKEGKIPVAQKADYRIIPVSDEEPLRRELLHFIECVKTRRKPITDGEEGLRVLKIINEAEKKLSSHHEFIKYQQEQHSNYFMHSSSYVDNNVIIGEGTKIWHFSHILENTTIGKNCIIGQNVAIGPDVTIGNNCKIQNNVSIFKGVTIDDDVFCGPSCVFTNVYNPRAFIERKHEFRKTIVKKGATIGANATIICGITIGEYAMIGAGAVVREDVLPYALVVGVPAKQIGWVCICGNTLRFQNNYAKCNYCNTQYRIEDGRLVRE